MDIADKNSKVKTTVVGHFGFGKELLNGQTIKTKILTEELDRIFGPGQIVKTDTNGGMKKLLTLPFVLWKRLRKSENVIILPAHNGLRIIAPLLAMENTFFHRRLHYVVIGGWLPEYLKKHTVVAKSLKKFSWIYVETTTMKKTLECAGYRNIQIMPNCKKLQILSESEIVCDTGEPHKLCTFSRVMKEKGIEDAVSAVTEINKRFGRTVYTLDIYGQIDSQQTEWFDELQKGFPVFVKYCGTVPFDQSVSVLKNYFALLFPTRFYTEGIPGTIIDAYAAGVPVIASYWENYSDMIDDGSTGFGYGFEDNDELIGLLEKIAYDPDRIVELKQNCLTRAKDYLPENVIDVLVNRL